MSICFGVEGLFGPHSNPVLARGGGVIGVGLEWPLKEGPNRLQTETKHRSNLLKCKQGPNGVQTGSERLWKQASNRDQTPKQIR